MTIDLHFTDEDWERIERDWGAWRAGELDRPLIIVEHAVPPPGITIPNIHNLGRLAASFPLSIPPDEVLDYYQVRLEAKRFHGGAWPKWWPSLGPGSAAGFLGARVHAAPDTVWFESSERVPIQDLEPTFEADNPWWQRVRDHTLRAVARWGDRVSVAHTDLGGNLDILASLVTTEQLLLDLIDHPAEERRLVEQITALWLHYYDDLEAIIRPAGRGTSPWATIWSPGRCYMLQSDFSVMISPKMFEAFVLPDLATCCEALDHAFYHMDSPGQIPHLDMLLSLERLRGIQWIPGAGAAPPEEWLPLLQRIRQAGKLCQLYVSPEGAQTIVRALGGRGFAFYIDQPMVKAEADSFQQSLLSWD